MWFSFLISRVPSWASISLTNKSLLFSNLVTCARIPGGEVAKTSQAKMGRADLGKGAVVFVSPQPVRAYRINKSTTISHGLYSYQL